MPLSSIHAQPDNSLQLRSDTWDTLTTYLPDNIFNDYLLRHCSAQLIPAMQLYGHVGSLFNEFQAYFR